MKIEFKREDFIDSLQIVNKAIKKGNLYPILDCVLIDASKNKIVLTAQDGKEVTIKKEALGEILEKGKAAIDASSLLDYVRSMPGGSFIELSVNEKKESFIKCGDKIKMEIQIKDETTYPNIININKDNKIIINEMKLRKALEKVIFSYDKTQETGNIVLKGIYFNINKDKFQVKSMDGYIISIVNELINNDKKYETIIPGTAIEELFRLLKGEVNKDVYIYFNEKNIAFEFNDTLLTSIIIPNKYIDTERIFNIEYNTRVNVNKEDLLNSLRRSVTMLRENDNKPVILDIKENNMFINLNSLSGNFSEEINIKKTGKELMIAFNARNLIKILNVIEDENVDLYFSGAKQPLIIKDKQETYSYLLTPVKI